MLRFLILEILLPLMVFALLRSILRSIFSAGRTAVQNTQRASQAPPPAGPPPVPAGGELRKDPVCGTYVSTAASLSRNIKGETFYYCSPECRDQHRA